MVIIPEHVPCFTSVTFRKRRTKNFDTPAGAYLYRDIPPSVYPAAVLFESSAQPRFLIAAPEKALCDLLYTIPCIRSIKGLEALLFEDLRIDQEQFAAFDHQSLYQLLPLYGTETLNLLALYSKKRYPEAKGA